MIIFFNEVCEFLPILAQCCIFIPYGLWNIYNSFGKKDLFTDVRKSNITLGAYNHNHHQYHQSNSNLWVQSMNQFYNLLDLSSDLHYHGFYAFVKEVENESLVVYML